MAIEAVKKALPDLPFPINEIDLIIGATYTPYDTAGTLAHAVQKQFNIVMQNVLQLILLVLPL